MMKIFINLILKIILIPYLILLLKNEVLNVKNVKSIMNINIILIIVENVIIIFVKIVK